MNLNYLVAIWATIYSLMSIISIPFCLPSYRSLWMYYNLPDLSSFRPSLSRPSYPHGFLRSIIPFELNWMTTTLCLLLPSRPYLMQVVTALAIFILNYQSLFWNRFEKNLIVGMSFEHRLLTFVEANHHYLLHYDHHHQYNYYHHHHYHHQHRYYNYSFHHYHHRHHHHHHQIADNDKCLWIIITCRWK